MAKFTQALLSTFHYSCRNIKVMLLNMVLLYMVHISLRFQKLQLQGFFSFSLGGGGGGGVLLC